LIHVGIDFDGTLVLYDDVFRRIACERFGAPDTVPGGKATVREYFWSRPGGREDWIRLQGLVYGPHLPEAEPAPGCLDVLRFCARRGVRVTVISHKTEFPVIGARVPLREAALAWLSDKGFFDPATGLDRGRVFFSSTREGKIEHIRNKGCTHFIDDLPELFAEASFPRFCARWLIDFPGMAPATGGVTIFRSWKAIGAALEDLAEAGDGKA